MHHGTHINGFSHNLPMSSFTPLLAAAIILLIIGLLIPGAFLLGLAVAGLWFAYVLADMLFNRDGAVILTAALIVTAAIAWLIL